MARIRSIKPDFWKSESIACHTFRARLTFIGLWTYVDDNGVGVDNPKLIAAEIFPLEEDPRETLANVREDLARLHEAGRIRRYTVEGKAYLAVVNFHEHQRIDKPGKPRYPGPDDERAIHKGPATSTDEDPSPAARDTLAGVSRGCREGVARPPCLEQGAGSREQGVRPTAERAALAPADADPGQPTNAQQLIGEWIGNCTKRPPGNVVGQISKHLKSMLDEGIDPADARRGLAAWAGRGLHPSTLPSVVNEVMNAPALALVATNGRPARPSTTDQRVNQALALAARYHEEEQP